MLVQARVTLLAKRHKGKAFIFMWSSLLKEVGKSLGDITADETDYRAKLREAKDDAEKDHCVRMVALKRLGVTANKNLDAAFNAIFN